MYSGDYKVKLRLSLYDEDYPASSEYERIVGRSYKRNVSRGSQYVAQQKDYKKETPNTIRKESTPNSKNFPSFQISNSEQYLNAIRNINSLTQNLIKALENPQPESRAQQQSYENDHQYLQEHSPWGSQSSDISILDSLNGCYNNSSVPQNTSEDIQIQDEEHFYVLPNSVKEVEYDTNEDLLEKLPHLKDRIQKYIHRRRLSSKQSDTVDLSLSEIEVRFGMNNQLSSIVEIEDIEDDPEEPLFNCNRHSREGTSSNTPKTRDAKINSRIFTESPRNLMEFNVKPKYFQSYPLNEGTCSLPFVPPNTPEPQKSDKKDSFGLPTSIRDIQTTQEFLAILNKRLMHLHNLESVCYEKPPMSDRNQEDAKSDPENTTFTHPLTLDTKFGEEHEQELQDSKLIEPKNPNGTDENQKENQNSTTCSETCTCENCLMFYIC